MLAGKLLQISSTPAFASVIDQYTVPDYVSLNAELLKAVSAWRETEPGLEKTNHLGWHSPRTFFTRPEPAFRTLGRHIRTALAQSLTRYWATFDPARDPAICEGWANVNGKGAFNTPHDHEGAHLSGSYYVSVPETKDEASGALEFLNPVGAGWPKLPNGEFMMRPTLFVPPQPGWILIFPAYLRHWVYPNQEDEERVSIAFNLRLEARPQGRQQA
jgi:uncharacterized protein (TIGR02466 family)